MAASLARSGYRLPSRVTPQAPSLYVHMDEPAALALTPSLLDRCAEHWHQLRSLHRWLVDYVQRPLAASA